MNDDVKLGIEEVIGPIRQAVPEQQGILDAELAAVLGLALENLQRLIAKNPEQAISILVDELCNEGLGTPAANTIKMALEL